MFVPPELWAVLLFSGQMADMYTTRRALEDYDAVEGNPLMAWLLSKVGIKGLQMFKSGMAGLLAAGGFFNQNEWF